MALPDPPDRSSPPPLTPALSAAMTRVLERSRARLDRTRRFVMSGSVPLSPVESPKASLEIEAFLKRTNEIAALKQKVETLENRFGRYQQAVQVLGKNVGTRVQRERSLGSELETLRAGLERLSGQMEREKSSFQSLLEQRTGETKHLEGNLQAAEAENVRSQERFQESAQEMTRLRAQVIALERKVGQMDGQKQDVDTNRSLQNMLGERQDMMEGRLSEQGAQLGRLAERVTAEERERLSLETRMSEARERMEAFHGDLIAMRRELISERNKTRQVLEWGPRIQAAHDQIHLLDTELRSLKDQARGVGREVTRSASGLGDLQAQMTEIRQELKRFEDLDHARKVALEEAGRFRKKAGELDLRMSVLELTRGDQARLAEEQNHQLQRADSAIKENQSLRSELVTLKKTVHEARRRRVGEWTADRWDALKEWLNTPLIDTRRR